MNDDQQSLCRNANVDCSASDLRLGIMGRYPPAGPAPLSPWVGAGIGYEWGTYSLHQRSSATADTDFGWSGFEFANLQLGADYSVAQRVVVAPFVSVSIGQFRQRSTTTTTGTGRTRPARPWRRRRYTSGS